MSWKLPKVEGRALKQKKKYFTLLLIPNNENTMRKWRIPGLLLPFVLILSLIGVSAIAFFSYGYFASLGEIESLQFLKGVNAAQEKRIKELQEQAKLLETKLETVDELENKVRAMIGLEGRTEEALPGEWDGVGGGLEPITWSALEADGSNNLQGAQAVLFTETLENEERQKDLDLRKEILPTSRAQPLSGRGEVSIEEVADNFDALKSRTEKKKVELEQLLVEVEDRLEYLACIPDAWPLEGKITSNFGMRTNPITKRGKELHEGIDIAARLGTPVTAAGQGTVVFAGIRTGWGRVVVIDHGNGYETQYSHNSTLLVKAGEKVTKGQAIARVGNSGRSTGSHLDFRIKKEGQYIDPKLLLEN